MALNDSTAAGAALTHRQRRPAARTDFEIAIICALPLEADAVRAVFDHHWDEDESPYDKAPGDPNAYSTGKIGRHNVVLAHMPSMGKVSAAAVAAHMQHSFQNIKLAVVAGICGCAPFTPKGNDIFLGDVIISDSIVQYDFGRRFPERFVRKDTLLDSLGRPNAEIRSLLAKLQGIRDQDMLREKMVACLATIQGISTLGARFPGTAYDSLFDAAYRHVTDDRLCDDCGCDKSLIRRTRPSQQSLQPAIHFGRIASGDTVLKSGQDRDTIARDENVIGFEMEGAGIWDGFPCVIIKGACGYADSHKTKAWQQYAAAAAAACVKAFLGFWVPSTLQANPQAISAGININSSRLISIPFQQNRNFVGRDIILEDLERRFIEQECQSLAIVGLGGVGKTQVALRFAYTVRTNHPNISIFWVSALSRASFEQVYIELGRKLGVSLKLDEEDPKESVCKYLNSEKLGKWLLIIDNVDDTILLETPSICDYLPESENGMVLFTTRSMDVGLSVAGNNIIELQEMTEEEAKRFLEKSLIRKQLIKDEAVMIELLKELEHLPLAITQAAAYINRNRISIRRYIQLLHSTERELVSLLSRGFRDNTRYPESQDAVATTWIMSFNQILEADPAAANLLSFIAYIEPKAIPRQLLPELESQEQMEYSIGTLSNYSFLTSRESGDVYDMHSLVHLAIRIWIERDRSVESVIMKALEHINKVFPSSDYANRQIWKDYLPHALRLLNRSEAYNIEERFNLSFRVGQCLFIDRRFKVAIKCFEEVTQWRAIRSSEGGGDGTLVYAWLGRAYLDDRRIKDAIEILEHVVEVWENTLKEEDYLRLTSKQVLAVAYLNDKRIKDAIEILEHVVEVRKNTLKEEDYSRLTSEYELARTYLEGRRINDAIKMLEHVVEVWRRTLKEDDDERLTVEHELARAYLEDKRIKDAIEILEHVVKVESRLFDVDDPERRTSLSLLGDAFRQLEAE